LGPAERAPGVPPAPPLALFDFAAVLVGMVFGRFLGVVRCVNSVPHRDVGVVGRFRVIAGFVMFGSFAMMRCRVFVVFCRLLVVVCACMHTLTFAFLCDDGILSP
jgi:hypothetical protein